MRRLLEGSGGRGLGACASVMVRVPRARPGDRKGRAGGPGAPIPDSVLARVPTAELAPNQTDQDTLPPYPVLDRIVKAYVEEDHSLTEIVRRQRLEPATVSRVIGMVDRAEYKRRQSPPGIKITPKAFGRDRRMPITNRFRQS